MDEDILTIRVKKITLLRLGFLAAAMAIAFFGTLFVMAWISPLPPAIPADAVLERFDREMERLKGDLADQQLEQLLRQEKNPASATGYTR